MNTIGIVALLFAACSTACGRQAVQESLPILVTPDVVIIDNLEVGAVGRYSLELKNQSQSDIELLRIESSCSCTVLESDPRILRANEVVAFNGTLTPTSRGPQEAKVEFVFKTFRLAVPILSFPATLEFWDKAFYGFHDLPRDRESS